MPDEKPESTDQSPTPDVAAGTNDMHEAAAPNAAASPAVDAEAAKAEDDEAGAAGDSTATLSSPRTFFSPEQLKSLLEVGRTAAVTGVLGGDGRLGERVARMESLLEEFVAEARERDHRMEETNRAMRAYFTDELGRLRETVTQELRVRASQRLLQEVLPILNDMDDLLARSEEAAQDEQTSRLWRALGAYRRRFYNGLRRIGLEEIKVVEGETLFDAYVHECVSTVEGGEEALPPGLIVGVRRRGYLFQNELFQAPQVIIRGGE